MSKSAELAKVVKKQKRRHEKEEAKRLKREQKKLEKKKIRERKMFEEIQKEELKKIEEGKKRSKDAKELKKEKKELKREKKELKKKERELMKTSLKHKKKKKKMEAKKIKKEQKKLQEQNKLVPTLTPSAPASTSDRDALSLLGGLFTDKKKEKNSDGASALSVSSSGSKPKIEVKRKVIAVVERTDTKVPSATVPCIVTPTVPSINNLTVPSIVTPTVPSINTPTLKSTTTAITVANTSTKTQNSEKLVIPTPVASPFNQQIRKPMAIKTPGERRDINPIYTTSTATITSITTVSRADPFVISGLNDTEESRLLTRTFANKWYLPAVLAKLEQQTGLNYRRGRFSEEEKLLAMRLTNKFCQEQNLTLETFKSVFFDDMSREVNNNNRLSNFFVDASQHFGGRPVAAIYEYMKRTYHPGNHRGAWTAEEDQILLREYEKHGPKWTLIGKELNRLGINCRDRYNLRWKHASSSNSGPWAKDECDRLKSFVDKSLAASGSVSWIWVAEEGVKTRTPLQCYNRWKLDNNGNPPNTNKPVSRIVKASATPKTPKTPKTQTPKTSCSWNGWKEDEDYLLAHAILTTGLNSDDLITWKSLKVPSIPDERANPELYFRRWNHLKSNAEIQDNENSLNLKGMVEKVKKYLVGKSKSAAYIFSEDEEEDF